MSEGDLARGEKVLGRAKRKTIAEGERRTESKTEGRRSREMSIDY
jgi:hypothetical protein